MRTLDTHHIFGVSHRHIFDYLRSTVRIDVVKRLDPAIVIPDDDQLSIASSSGDFVSQFSDTVRVTRLNPILFEDLLFSILRHHQRRFVRRYRRGRNRRYVP